MTKGVTWEKKMIVLEKEGNGKKLKKRGLETRGTGKNDGI